MNADFAPHCGPEEHCITCGDEGMPMRVVEIDAQKGLAVCGEQDGERRVVEVGLVAPVAAGDMVLVHADVALTRLDAKALG